MLNETDLRDTRKVVLIGEKKTGKSNLLSVLSKESFNPEHVPTPGIEFASKYISTDNRSLHLQIWDAPGDLMTEQLRHMAPTYFRGATAVIFVYDVTDRASFENLEVLWETAQTHLATLGTQGKDYVTILLGNKIDLGDKRVVTADEAKKFAEGKFTLVQEASAKHSVSLNNAFAEVARLAPALKTAKVDIEPSSAAPRVPNYDGKLQALIEQLSRKKACGCFTNKEQQAKQIEGVTALKTALREPGAKPAETVDDIQTRFPEIKHNRDIRKLMDQISKAAPEIKSEQSTSHGM